MQSVDEILEEQRLKMQELALVGIHDPNASGDENGPAAAPSLAKGLQENAAEDGAEEEAAPEMRYGDRHYLHPACVPDALSYTRFSDNASPVFPFAGQADPPCNWAPPTSCPVYTPAAPHE